MAKSNKSKASCCVPGCKTTGYVDENSQPVTFHGLPLQDKDRLREWIVRIKRDVGPQFKVTKHTKICSRHFLPGDFRVTPKGRRFIKEDKHPSIFDFKTPVVTRKRNRTDHKESASPSVPDEHSESDGATANVDVSSLTMQSLNLRIQFLEQQLMEEKKRSEIIVKERDHARSVLSQALAKDRNEFDIENFKSSDVDICFYTGFPTYTTLEACYKLLDPENHILVRSSKRRKVLKDDQLSYMNQFFLTLVRLRLGLLVKDIAKRFHISQSAVHKYYDSWINYMYLRLGSLNIWPPKEVINRTMPETMRQKFATLEWIIDAFEIQIQRPSSLMLQSQSYSSYKSRNTVKGLVACTPSGQIGFVSQLYTGNISDRELVIRSGFLDMPHRKGAVWLVDKGFQIQDLADKLGVIVNMPAFVGTKGHLTAKEVFHTQ